MPDRDFARLLRKRWEQGLFTCVGLDIDVNKIPEHLHVRNRKGELKVYQTTLLFVRAIVEATRDHVCAYKPNFCFNENTGAVGMATLQAVVRLIHKMAPSVPVIVDRKANDIGNTNLGTVQGLFGYLGADATTLSPYMGGESLAPFLECSHKGMFVLCRTSNPGAGEFQDLIVEEHDAPLYAVVAENVSRIWNSTSGNCGLVVGATAPEQFTVVRQRAPKLPILIPGIGAQGGDLAASVAKGQTSEGDGIIINASRSVVYASAGTNFAEAALAEMLRMNATIEAHRLRT
ncbi:MAG: orotidine-5-phosphate decarboxylase [Patescibacteria group bacterium]|nr:orotidine-5-phosphate decarboxylase [Patescibacteria group bacterium]